MSHNLITYEIQGSAPDPYILKISLDPFTISCTCPAALNGLLCKHRLGIVYGKPAGLQIIKGDLSFLPQIHAGLKETDFFDMLKHHDKIKVEKKNALKKADSAYKSYREARENFVLKRVKTDKAVVRCNKAFETAIDESIEAEKVYLETLKPLQAVFIRPYVYMVDQALS